MSICDLGWVNDPVRRLEFHGQLNEFHSHVEAVGRAAALNGRMMRVGVENAIELPRSERPGLYCRDAIELDEAAKAAWEKLELEKADSFLTKNWRAVVDAAAELLERLEELDRKVGELGRGGSQPADPGPALVIHDLGYRSASWGEKEYHFNKKQAAVFERLVEASAGMPDKELLAAADSWGRDLRDLFRRKRRGTTEKHPAWGELIVPVEGRKGWRELAAKKIKLPRVTPS